MKLLNNKGLSILLMVALIIAGFWLGGYRSLHSLYGKAEAVFFHGEDNDGICIANDLSERAAAATNLVTVARKYSQNGAEDLQTACTAVSDAVAQLQAVGTDIAECLIADKELEACVELLYRALTQTQEETGLTEKDEAYRQRLYAEFQSRGDTISHDPYNRYAESYNQTLQRFPANLLAAVTPIEQAILFY